MTKEIPCPFCCKHIKIPTEDWVKGGVFECKFCGYRIKLPAHPANPDDVMLKKPTKSRKPKELSKAVMDAITPDQSTGLDKAIKAYEKSRIKPHFKIEDRNPGGKAKYNVEVGVKIEF